jgi:hypothetical protein
MIFLLHLYKKVFYNSKILKTQKKKQYTGSWSVMSTGSLALRNGSVRLLARNAKVCDLRLPVPRDKNVPALRSSQSHASTAIYEHTPLV